MTLQVGQAQKAPKGTSDSEFVYLLSPYVITQYANQVKHVLLALVKCHLTFTYPSQIRATPVFFAASMTAAATAGATFLSSAEIMIFSSEISSSGISEAMA